MKPIDISGKKFGRLTVLKYDETSRGKGHAKWICSCSCGTKVSVRASHLKTGGVTSCGCYSREVSSKVLKKYASSDKHKGSGNPQWKGDDAQHSSIHTWLNKTAVKVQCVKCGSKKNLDFALKKGKKHSHNLLNYIVLCRSHHLEYDYTPERKAKISKSLTGKKRI